MIAKEMFLVKHFSKILNEKYTKPKQIPQYYLAFGLEINLIICISCGINMHSNTMKKENHVIKV